GQVLNSARLVSSSPASVTTDKTDYAPGTIVTITGKGFQPNEDVAMALHERPDAYPDFAFTANADNQGNFTFMQFAPQSIDVGRTFTLTAIGQSSGFTAQTAFKDSANKVTFSTTANGAEISSFGTLSPDQCQAAFVQARQGSNLGNPVSNLNVGLSSSPAGATFFSGSVCSGGSISSVTISTSETSKSFSFKISTT